MLNKSYHTFDDTFRVNQGDLVAGADEAGRGAWAGPIVAAAVIMPATLSRAAARTMPEIADSKKLSEAKRDEAYEYIVEQAVAWEVRVLSSDVVDEIGVHQANLNALSLALTGLDQLPVVGLIDGFAIQHYIPTERIVAGDAKSFSIAAASILAKVTRDRLMKDLDIQLPDYGFAQHKGYGTLKHRAALRKYGVTPHHRKSFTPIGELLNNAL